MLYYLSNISNTALFHGADRLLVVSFDAVVQFAVSAPPSLGGASTPSSSSSSSSLSPLAVRTLNLALDGQRGETVETGGQRKDLLSVGDDVSEVESFKRGPRILQLQNSN